MARRSRAEATKHRIIDVAVDLFDDIGYPATTMGHILGPLQMTKGALYYHFQSKEAVALAIIEEGATVLADTFRRVCQSPGPAIENIIHSTFVMADTVANDKLARSAVKLAHTIGLHNDAVLRIRLPWLEMARAQLQRALEEGDLNDDVNPDIAADVIVGAVLGVSVMWFRAAEQAEVVASLGRTWTMLLPGLVSQESLAYLREFLAREPLRLPESDSSNAAEPTAPANH